MPVATIGRTLNSDGNWATPTGRIPAMRKRLTMSPLRGTSKAAKYSSQERRSARV
ncbi:MAG: hypothetical protein JWO83_445 [Caulobacteraceae bacterium]|nr:hypothetical protein [Caulobacteraceae bacterium]